MFLPTATPTPARLLILNTVLYSKRATAHTSEEDPCGQYEWLMNELEQAREVGGVVYLMAHILPGLNGGRGVVGCDVDV